MDFFNEEFQKKILGITESKKLVDESCASFHKYYTGINEPYKSKCAKYGEHFINSHFIVKIPKDVYSLKIEINFDLKSLNRVIDNHTSSIAFKKSNGIAIRERYAFLKEKTFRNDYSLLVNDLYKNLNLEFVKNERIKENSFIVFSASNILKNPDIHTQQNLDWTALDLDISSEKSIKVQSTTLPGKENINFQELVYEMSFSENIKSLKLGFLDKPKHFEGDYK